MIVTLDLTWITIYLPFLLIGIGLGIIMTIKGSDKRIQNAKDNLEAKKEWVRLVSSQTKVGDKNGRRR
jgi:hypothetical protein